MTGCLPACRRFRFMSVVATKTTVLKFSTAAFSFPRIMAAPVGGFALLYRLPNGTLFQNPMPLAAMAVIFDCNKAARHP